MASASWAVQPIDMNGAAIALGISRRTLSDAIKSLPREPWPIACSDMLDRRRIVMAKWADHVTGKAAEVVQLRRK